MITSVEQIQVFAKENPSKPRVIVAGAESASIVETVAKARQKGVCEVTLIGRREQVLQAAHQCGADPDQFRIAHVDDPERFVMESLLAIKAGEGDILMKGGVTTRQVLKGVLEKQLGFRTGNILSHVSVFNVPGEHRIMIISDAGVNISPDLAKKKAILLNAVSVAHALGNDMPKVAMLSFVEEITDPEEPCGAEAGQLVQMNRTGEIPGCVIEGPYSLDVALSPEAASIKGVKGQVAGRAEVLVMHDIGMGNILFKALMLWTKPTIAATIVGSSIPIAVTSRADSMENKINSIALAALLWVKKKQA